MNIQPNEILYPKNQFGQPEKDVAILGISKENKKIFVLKIVNRNGPVWGPIKYRPEHGLQQPLSTRDAGLAVYGPKVSIFAKHRRGGNRSLRKRYRKRRQTLRRTRR